MSNKVVLDSSALLALIQSEKGAEVVRPLLKQTVMSTVNVAEVLTALQRVNIFSEEATNAISEIVPFIIPFDLEQAQNVAKLYLQVKSKGLSLGDRACLAVGMKLQAPIYTADKIWRELRLENVEIRLIR